MYIPGMSIACTAFPARKGTVLTSCGTPSRITSNERIPGTYPWYAVSIPEKKNYEGQKGKKEKGKEKTRKEKRNKSKHALRAHAESRGDQGAVCWYDQMICPIDGPPEGRHEKTRRKTRRKEGRHKVEKKKPNKPATLCPAGGPRRTQETKKRVKTKGFAHNNKTKQKVTKTKQIET